MNRGSKADRLKLLAEGATIVLSILLAFGIDALWDERQERRAENEAIEQLVADFRINASRLDSVRAVHERALDANYQLLDLTAGDWRRADLSGTAQLVRYSHMVWTYDPALGGINSLVQSGRLGLLRNDSLRVAVAGWPDLVEDLNEDEVIESRNTFDRLAPYFMERGVIMDVLMSVGSLDRLDVMENPDVSAILGDPIYRQMLAWRINGLENVLTEYDLLESETRRIQRLLGDSSTTRTHSNAW